MKLLECFQYLIDCNWDVRDENANANPELKECCEKIKAILFLLEVDGEVAILLHGNGASEIIPVSQIVRRRKL